jgi:hypothetical protein
MEAAILNNPSRFAICAYSRLSLDAEQISETRFCVAGDRAPEIFEGGVLPVETILGLFTGSRRSIVC